MADLVVPALGESITEAVVSVWLKQVGDAVAADEPVAELETDKVTVQLPSPVAGVLAAQVVPVGATVRVGDVIGSVKPGAAKAEAKPAARPAAAASSAAPVQAVVAAAPTRSGNGDGLDKAALLKLTPSQRVAAREIGTIPHHAPVAPPPAAAPAGPSAEDRLAHVDPRDEVVAMSPLRRRVAERLVQAQHEAASLTTFNEVDMTAVIELRTKYKDSFEKTHGVKLG